MQNGVLTPSRWYAAREIYSLFGIFWNSNNCSDRQIQLVESSQPLKCEKSSLVTFGIKVPPDPVEPWFVRLCELSPWLPFQLPAIWSKRACKAAIISCNSLRVCYWLEVKETDWLPRLPTFHTFITHVLLWYQFVMSPLASSCSTSSTRRYGDKTKNKLFLVMLRG